MLLCQRCHAAVMIFHLIIIWVKTTSSLYALSLTIGILLPEIIRDARSDLVDSGSYWHEQFCQNDFVRRPERDDVDSWITYTRIRGAIDGGFSVQLKQFMKYAVFNATCYHWFLTIINHADPSCFLLGYILGLHGNLTSAVSLCSLLDGYYSNRGVDRSMRTKPDLTYDNGNSVQLGVCRRYDLFPADVLTGNLEREFLNFYRAFAYAYPGLVNRVSEAIVMDAATRVIKKITRATQYKLLSMPSFCDDGPALSIANRK